MTLTECATTSCSSRAIRARSSATAARACSSCSRSSRSARSCSSPARSDRSRSATASAQTTPRIAPRKTKSPAIGGSASTESTRCSETITSASSVKPATRPITALRRSEYAPIAENATSRTSIT